MRFIVPLILAISLAMVCFTDPEGLGVWVDHNQIVSASHPRDCVDNANTKLTLSNGTFLCIREKIKEVVSKIEAAK